MGRPSKRPDLELTTTRAQQMTVSTLLRQSEADLGGLKAGDNHYGPICKGCVFGIHRTASESVERESDGNQDVACPSVVSRVGRDSLPAWDALRRICFGCRAGERRARSINEGGQTGRARTTRVPERFNQLVIAKAVMSFFQLVPVGFSACIRGD